MPNGREQFYIRNRKTIQFINSNFLIRVEYPQEGRTELKGAGMIVDVMGEEHVLNSFAKIKKRLHENFTWWKGSQHLKPVTVKFLAK